MKEPIEPTKEDCCNSGCNPCIFDVYEKQLKLYKKYLEQGSTSEILIENSISQLQYGIFVVVKNVEVCEGHHEITFKAKVINDNKKIIWNPGDHFLIKYTSGDYTCSRAYTPLRQKLLSDSEFLVIIKKYTKGVVSQYLCNLNPGQETLWRGPYGFYNITPNKFDVIIMIAQGTGIVTLISIIDSILNDEDDMTKIILYYCCQNIDLILFRDKLYSWKEFWNFTYTIHLSQCNSNDVFKYQEPIISHRLNTDNLLTHKPLLAKHQILLSGSTQFMDFYHKFFGTTGADNIYLF